MALNLLESTTELTNNNGFTAAAARLVGETPAATKSALGYMMPATIAGLAKQAETPEGASNMMETLASAPGVGELGDFATLGNRANTLVSWGASFAKRIFGDRTPPVANAVATLSGVKPESVSTLFFVTLPMILAFLKQHVAANGLDANGLRQVLAGQLKAVQPRLDPRVAAAVGVAPSASWEPSRETTRPPAPTISPVTAQQPSGLRRLVPWAALAAAALLVFSLLRNRPSASPTPVTAVAPNTTAAITPAAPNTTATSPGDVAPTAAAALPLSLHFDVSSADLSPADQQSLTAVAQAITQNGTHVDITGYTDPTGNHAANVELAKNRAVAVRNALESAGVPAAQINMKPPSDITGAGSADDARRVDLTQSQ
jgi:outer membrane protein OmpA-like peptidoglycan-associated protein